MISVRIVKRTGKTGQISWLVKWRDGVTDRTKSFSTKAEAEYFKATLTVEVFPRPPKGSTPPHTLRDAYDRFVKVKGSGGRAATTIETYRFRFAHLEDLADLDLSGITVAVVNDQMARLRKRGVSSATINKVQLLFSGILDLAIAEDRYSGDNPVKKAVKVKVPPPAKPPVALDIETVKKLASEIPDDQRAVFWMAAGLGMRRGEIEALRRDDFNADFTEVRISRTKRDKYEREAKTKTSVRTLAIPDFITEELRKVTPQSDGRMFVCNSKWGRKYLTPALERLGIEPFGIHGLRDVAAGILIVEGRMDPILVSQVLGHSSPYVTMTRYAGHRKNASIVAAGTMGDLYGKPKKSKKAKKPKK